MFLNAFEQILQSHFDLPLAILILTQFCFRFFFVPFESQFLFSHFLISFDYMVNYCSSNGFWLFCHHLSLTLNHSQNRSHSFLSQEDCLIHPLRLDRSGRFFHSQLELNRKLLIKCSKRSSLCLIFLLV